MRGRLLVVVVALLALAAAAPGAASAADAVSLISDSGGTVVADTEVPVSASGAITVDFHGDTVAGCTAIGVCGYAGTITVVPPSGLTLDLLKLRRGSRLSYDSVLFGSLGPQANLQTSARVTRALPGGGVARCTDAVGGGYSFTAPSVHDAKFTLPLLEVGSDLLATRCAGPTDAQLAAVAPHITVALGSVLRGHLALDLQGTSNFSSGGFAGTLTSSLVLHLGAPARQRPSGLPPQIKLVRTRLVSESLRVTGVTGSLQALVSGAADPGECALLDSCGLTGTTTLSPVASASAGELDVDAPARLPEARFLAALGLAPRPRVGALTAYGSVVWTDTHAPAVVVTQSGDTCQATASPVQENLILQTVGRRLVAALSSPAPLRSACPGPFLGSPTGDATLATGSIPSSALGRRTFTVRLRPGGGLSDDGYVIRLSGALAVTLRRGAIVQRIESEPALQ